ncbi:MAG: deoxynucleoside kinase [Anaerolineae bacterium]|nr:deoxynucleoside kinase [Anaerolineae bacterium]MCX8068794.1 deoxynucleoside kinase [Anaerolineae bacterium]MDW7990736.1 deoxynucleoside kinase [Anaerolineae bacterium]
MKKWFVAIAGNIGVGKSTLTEMLSQRLGWEPFFEAVSDNPYLADFYQDMARWGFHSQIFFLSRRLLHHYQLLQRPNSVIQDRTVYEDAEIFARNLYRQGLMSERDYRSYRELYEVVRAILPPPDLVVYLRASVPTLLRRIAQRGRPFERAIAPEYLEQLNVLYEEWISQFSLCPVLTVPSDRLDFVANSYHLDLIVEKILEKLQGREEVVFPE